MFLNLSLMNKLCKFVKRILFFPLSLSQMEANFDVITSSIRNKISTLITSYEQQKTKNRELEIKNKELLNKVVFLEKKLTETEEKYNNIKLAKTIVAVEDNAHDAKIKMNRIVREIDNCIALLNR